MRNNLSRFAFAAILVAVLFTQAAFAYKVHLNQVGFGATAQKQAVYNGTPTGTITIRSIDGGTVKQTIPSGVPKTWEHSGELTNRLLDFSSVTTPGNYAIFENNTMISPPFQIGVSYDKLTRDALRFYYYHRADYAISGTYAEGFARSAGHSGKSATIYNFAGTSTSNTITSYRGWYDAGDYGRYVVNSGISVYTLLALYEKYADKIPALNIPPDGTLPLLLAEIKWNLDWMLTMQDVTDGGVYHKMTTKDFPDLSTTPAGDISSLMVMGKTTAATLDFAAVMAVASRIYRPLNPSYADQMLAAAKKAWNWATTNPVYCYNRNSDYLSTCDYKSNDPTNTGPYEDDDIDDEFFFAAVALSTVTDATEQSTLGLSTHINQFGNFYDAPSWKNVGTLGNYEIIRNKNKFQAKYDDVLNLLTRHADWMLSEYENGYGLPIGNIFWWGSNSEVTNIGILFMELYEATKNIKYKNAAQATFDYVLGRNPIDQSYVTGYGNKSPLYPHDRLTIGSYNGRVFPGQVVGGVASGCYDDGKYYDKSPVEGPAATRYKDDKNCPAWNEITINWNAPVAYLSAVLSEPDGSPIEKIELVTKIDNFANGSAAGITAGEVWDNSVVNQGAGTTTISNVPVFNASGKYAELVSVSISLPSWDDWAQAAIELNTENNGVLYDLAQCSNGFRYKYRGKAHRFSLDFKDNDLGVTYYYKNTMSDVNVGGEWTTITANYSNNKVSCNVDDHNVDCYSDFARDYYDGANCGGNSSCPTKKTIPLNLSKVKQINWIVRPFGGTPPLTVTGNLQIKDFECLGILTVIGSIEEKNCIDAGKIWENSECRDKRPDEICLEAGNTWVSGQCKTPAQICTDAGKVLSNDGITCRDKTPEEICLGAGKIWENGTCRDKTPAEACTATGGVWENGICNQPVQPIRLSQITSIRNILARTIDNAIILQNLPSNAKAEVYSLQGKRIYSTHSGNSQILKIPVQTKGMYIVKVSSGSEIKILRMAVR